MADPFVGEIRAFPFNFAPKGWALCNGQLLPLTQNTALFSLLGTNYGGDGKSTFGLPDLQGRVAIHPGQGPGLSWHDLGEEGGVEFVTLLESEIPAHAHPISASADEGESRRPIAGHYVAESTPGDRFAPGSSTTVTMAPKAMAPAGGNLPHNNMMPYLTVNYCIAMQGVFPPRS